jgi:Holliday junction resolvasome RuvABC endonuclease subunit
MALITVAGLDPSLRNFGMVKGTVDTAQPDTFRLQQMALQETTAGAKTKQVRKNSDDLERARLLYRTMTEFLQGVELVMVEVPVGSQSADGMKSYGVCLGLLSTIGLPMIQVTPTEVKLAAVGTKTASKLDMIHWAVDKYPTASWFTRKLLGKHTLTNKNEHLADAVAAVHAGMNTDEFKRLIAFAK